MMLLAVVCRGWSRLSPYGGRRKGHETTPSSQPRSISADQRGSTAVEFAIVSPILILLLLGIVVYGGYFMLSHSLQEMADDAARASIAGLTDTERSSLAQSAVSNDIQTYSYFSPQLLQVNYADQNQTTLTVTLTYNASNSPFWALNGLVPMPSSTLVRSASVQIGGY